METKVCSKCKEEKKNCEFGNSKSSDDGLLYCCKKCNNERSKIYRNENYQKTLEQHRKWTAKNPEWVYNRYKKWREENPDKVKELKKTKNFFVEPSGFVLINNRLQTLILIFTIFGFNLIVKNKKKIFTRNTLIIVLISIYLLKVIVNVRNNFVDNDGNIRIVEVINPFYQTQLDENDPLSNRLNGIDLISIYYPKMFLS